MKELKFKISEAQYKVLEEITEHHNEKIGIRVTIEETLKEIISVHYLTEVVLKNETVVN